MYFFFLKNLKINKTIEKLVIYFWYYQPSFSGVQFSLNSLQYIPQCSLEMTNSPMFPFPSLPNLPTRKNLRVLRCEMDNVFYILTGFRPLLNERHEY